MTRRPLRRRHHDRAHPPEMASVGIPSSSREERRNWVRKKEPLSRTSGGDCGRRIWHTKTWCPAPPRPGRPPGRSAGQPGGRVARRSLPLEVVGQSRTVRCAQIRKATKIIFGGTTEIIRSDSCEMVTSAEASVPWLSLISTCRCRSCSPMPGLLRWDSWRGRRGGRSGLFRPDRDLPAPALAHDRSGRGDDRL